MRYIAMEVSFGGFLTEKTVDELLYGYTEPFLEVLKTMNP